MQNAGSLWGRTAEVWPKDGIGHKSYFLFRCLVLKSVKYICLTYNIYPTRRGKRLREAGRRGPRSRRRARPRTRSAAAARGPRGFPEDPHARSGGTEGSVRSGGGGRGRSINRRRGLCRARECGLCRSPCRDATGVADPWPWARQRTLTPAANATGCAPAGLAPGLCLRAPRAPAPQAAAPRRARPGRRTVQVRGAPTSPPPTPPPPSPESGSQGVRCDLPRGCGLAGEMRAPWPCLSDQRVHRGLAPDGRAGGRGRVRTGGDAGMLQPQPRTATPVGPRRPEVAGASALGVSGPCRRLGLCIRRESDVSRSETPRSWRPFAVTAQDSVE